MAYRKSAFPNYKGEVNNEPSMTKPGQSMSVVALFKQFGVKDMARDYEFDVSKQSVDDILNSETMLDGEDVDLTDVSEAISQVKETIKNVKHKKEEVKEASSGSDVQDPEKRAEEGNKRVADAGQEGK